MSALGTLAGKLPGWLYGAVLLCVLAGAGMLHQRSLGAAQGRVAVQALWDADKKARATAETKAVAQRAAENLAQARQQAANALAITKAYDEEINDVRARLAAADLADAGLGLPATANSRTPAVATARPARHAGGTEPEAWRRQCL